MLINLISWCLFGLVVGLVARLLVPGNDGMGCLATTALGIVGSLVGGYLGHAVAGQESSGVTPAGFIGAVVGGVLVLGALRLFAPRRQP